MGEISQPHVALISSRVTAPNESLRGSIPCVELSQILRYWTKRGRTRSSTRQACFTDSETPAFAATGPRPPTPHGYRMRLVSWAFTPDLSARVGLRLHGPTRPPRARGEVMDCSIKRKRGQRASHLSQLTAAWRPRPAPGLHGRRPEARSQILQAVRQLADGAGRHSTPALPGRVRELGSDMTNEGARGTLEESSLATRAEVTDRRVRNDGWERRRQTLDTG